MTRPPQAPGRGALIGATVDWAGLASCRPASPIGTTSVPVSAVSLDERVADRGQVVSHTRRAGHLDPFDQPGKLAGEHVFVVAADHDLDAAVGRGTSHLEPTAEPHPQ